MDTNTIEKHNLTLEGRKNIEMDGVKEVLSFNESQIVLQTNKGTLDIKGKNLNIQQLNLDNTNIKIEGYVNSLVYSNKAKEKNFFKRIFK